MMPERIWADYESDLGGTCVADEVFHYWYGVESEDCTEYIRKDVADAEKAVLIEALNQAVKYLKEGKAKFAPSTTNSFVDVFIARWGKEDK